MTVAIPFLEVRNVTKSYTGAIFSGIKEVSLEIKKGKITAIIGRSGSGKSTLLNLIYGLLSPDKGVVSFQGEKVLGPGYFIIKKPIFGL